MNCEFVSINGTWLPGVASVQLRPVLVGDSERAVSGTLRTAFTGYAREWTVQLVGVSGDDHATVFDLLTDPSPVPVNVMGEELTAAVFLEAVIHTPVFAGSARDVGAVSFELSIKEVFVDYPLPGFAYEYQSFTEPGAFTWNWNDAGQPSEVDILLVGGGGAGAGFGPVGLTRHGGGGGAGGVLEKLKHSVSGNISGVVGAGGTGGKTAPAASGGDTTASGFTATGGGGGGDLTTDGRNGGSGGGGSSSNSPRFTNLGGSGVAGQGHAGGNGGGGSAIGAYAGGGGGASTAGQSRPAHGGAGVDLLALGWNYRLAGGVPRLIAGGGAGYAGIGSYGGGSGARPASTIRHARSTTGGGGGGGRDDVAGGNGSDGFAIIRWRVGS